MDTGTAGTSRAGDPLLGSFLMCMTLCPQPSPCPRGISFRPFPRGLGFSQHAVLGTVTLLTW